MCQIYRTICFSEVHALPFELIIIIIDYVDTKVYLKEMYFIQGHACYSSIAHIQILLRDHQVFDLFLPSRLLAHSLSFYGHKNKLRSENAKSILNVHSTLLTLYS